MQTLNKLDKKKLIPAINKLSGGSVLVVGDIIQLHDKMNIPCDCILI